jgi:hypothetical protein
MNINELEGWEAGEKKDKQLAIARALFSSCLCLLFSKCPHSLLPPQSLQPGDKETFMWEPDCDVIGQGRLGPKQLQSITLQNLVPLASAKQMQ